VYRWWVFLHIAGVFGFLVAHGASVTVAFKLRGERDPRRIVGLLELSASSVRALYASLGVLLLGGIVAGFAGHWWGYAWIWASIGILLLVMVAMWTMASPYYRRVGVVARAMAGGSEAVTHEQLDGILRSRRPWSIAWIGFGGLLAILYLMLFKPTLGFSVAAAPPPAACSPGGTAVEVTAAGVAFDPECLAAPAGTAFTIVMDNRDTGVRHNVSLYTDPSASRALFVGELVPGPVVERYDVEALPAGTYVFRCDEHPAQMVGTFVVA
jgi:plastocyanin